MSQTTRFAVRAPKRPFKLRVKNFFGSLIPWIPDLSPETMVEEAKRFTDLSEWDDDRFLDGLRALVDSFKREGGAHFLGRRGFRMSCIFQVAIRLQICAYLKKHPEVLDTKIRKPLFITGFPRTGTTLLQNLLSLDPNARPLLFWETLQPFPSPTPETYDSDPRIRYAAQYIQHFLSVIPNYMKIHPIGPQKPEEGHNLLANEFHSTLQALNYRVPSFGRWLLKQDMIPAYASYKKQLQILGYHFQDKHWVLKAPMHMIFLDALLHVFPDASVVVTHRNLEDVLPSFCSLTATVRKVNTHRVDLIELGADRVEGLRVTIERGMRSREKADAAHFLDIGYKNLVSDPVGAVRSVYEYFGYEYTGAFEDRVRQYLAENKKGKHGSHHYSLEQFGLTRERLHDVYGEYYRKYGDYL